MLVALIRRKHVDTASHSVKVPGLSAVNVLVKSEGLVLSKYTYGVNTGVNAVRQGEVNDLILTAKGNCRLCDLLCEIVKTGALSSRKEHCYTFFFTVHVVSP